MADHDPAAEAALRYARRGWRVVPLHHLTERADGSLACSCDKATCGKSAGKHPRFLAWAVEATADPAVVAAWWRTYPRTNVGVAFGPGSGLVGLDVDGPAGEALLLDLAGGEVLDTVECRTGNGRRLLFAHPPGPPLKTRSLKGPDGTEALRFQGEGSQGVLPPSRHYTGRYYEWAPGHGDVDRVPAPLPPRLAILLAHPEQRPHFSNGGAVDLFGAPGSDFNRRGDWAALLESQGATFDCDVGDVQRWTRPGKDGGCSATVNYWQAKDGTPALYVFSGSWPGLVGGKCYDKFGAYTHLLHAGDFKAAAAALKEQGYGLRRPAASPSPSPSTTGPAAAAPPAEPIDWPAPQPVTDDPPPPREFPAELVFPGELAAFCREIASGCNCPVDFPALFMLGMSSGLLGATRAVRLTDTWVERGLLFCAAVAPKSSGKTPAFMAIKEPAKREQARRARRDEDGVLFLTDLTLQSLPARLKKQPRGIMAAVDELSGWASSFDQYKAKGSGSDRQQWLEIWAGGSMSVARANKESPYQYIANPFVAVCGGIQPAVLDDLAGRDDGLMERFLFVKPKVPPPAGKRRVKYQHQKAWEATANSLMGELMVTDELLGPKPLVMELHDATWAVFERWTDEIAAGMTDPARNPALDGALRKLEGYAARLAVVLDGIQRAHQPGQTRDDKYLPCVQMENAVELARFFREQAEVVYRARDPGRAELAERLYAVLRKPLDRPERPPAGITCDGLGRVTSFTRSALWLRMRRAVPSQEALAKPLKLLRELNAVAIQQDGAGDPGRPRKDAAVYLVNPRIHCGSPAHETNDRDGADDATR